MRITLRSDGISAADILIPGDRMFYRVYGTHIFDRLLAGERIPESSSLRKFHLEYFPTELRQKTVVLSEEDSMRVMRGVLARLL